MSKHTVRRTFPAARLTLDDLQALLDTARAEGLDGSALLGFTKSYRSGWRIEFTAHGEEAIARFVCPECRDGKHGNCTGWSIDDHDDIVDCRCDHGE